MPIPIPKRPSGYVRGAANALLQIEAFIDIQCPFSRTAWPTLLAVADHYGPEKVQLRAQLISMANHRQSWDMTKAIVAVVGADSEQFFKLATFLYDRQDQFKNAPFKERTEVELYDLIVRLLAEFGYRTDPKEFIERLDNSRALYDEAKIPSRIAFSRGVWSTPTFYINGAEVIEYSDDKKIIHPFGSSSTLEEWNKILEPLLN
jgi:protein-disulfide isomerase